MQTIFSKFFRAPCEFRMEITGNYSSGNCEYVVPMIWLSRCPPWGRTAGICPAYTVQYSMPGRLCVLACGVLGEGTMDTRPANESSSGGYHKQSVPFVATLTQHADCNTAVTTVATSAAAAPTSVAKQASCA